MPPASWRIGDWRGFFIVIGIRIWYNHGREVRKMTKDDLSKDDLWRCCYSCAYYKACTSHASPLAVENCDRCLARDEVLAYGFAIQEHPCYRPHIMRVMEFDSGFWGFANKDEAIEGFHRKYH